MRTFNQWTLAMMLLGSSALLSCGGVPSEPLDATTGAFVLGNFGTSLNTLPTSNTVPALPITGVTTSSIGLKAVSSCESVTPTTTVDADNDGIAASKKYIYDCTDVVDNGYSYTRKGSVEIKDMDETKVGMFGGLRVDFAVPVFKSIDLSTGNPFEYSYSGFWDYKNSGGSLVSASEFTGSTKYKNNNYENDYQYTSTWNYKLTPTNEATPWNEGSIEIEGSYQLTGNFVYENDQGTHAQREGGWLITYKTKDLVYSNTCAKFYKSGSFVIEDSSNKIEVVYNCSTAKLYVNGSESDWWKP